MTIRDTDPKLLYSSVGTEEPWSWGQNQNCGNMLKTFLDMSHVKGFLDSESSNESYFDQSEPYD